MEWRASLVNELLTMLQLAYGRNTHGRQQPPAETQTADRRVTHRLSKLNWANQAELSDGHLGQLLPRPYPDWLILLTFSFNPFDLIH